MSAQPFSLKSVELPQSSVMEFVRRFGKVPQIGRLQDQSEFERLLKQALKDGKIPPGLRLLEKADDGTVAD